MLSIIYSRLSGGPRGEAGLSGINRVTLRISYSYGSVATFT
jgi:hypothetical protein